MNQPSEPDVTKSGLAKQHLKSGYQHDVWEYYQVGKDKSVKKCEEICGIINAYEETIFTEIEREIRTSSGNQKLERKNRGEVFIGKYYPDKFDRFVKSLYLYPDILYAIFNEAHSRNNGIVRQKVRIKKNNDYEYLVISNLESRPSYMGGNEQELGFGVLVQNTWDRNFATLQVYCKCQLLHNALNCQTHANDFLKCE